MTEATSWPGPEDGAAVVVEWSRGAGWARRTVYGGGGPAGAAWRGIARPLGWAWRRVADRRLGRPSRPTVRLPSPAIAIGNVTVGGGGKTSLVTWLLAAGLPASARAAVLSRGHGRAGTGVWVLPPGAGPEAARGAGDEPALHARAGAWVGVAPDRARAARAVVAQARVDVFLLDDALQHRRIARALDLIAFTADDLAAPARCLPTGPLRQGPGWRPPNGAWVVAGADPRDGGWPPGSIGAAFASWWDTLPGTAAEWRVEGPIELAAWRAVGAASPLDPASARAPFEPAGRPVVAFAGVARPEAVAVSAARAGFPVSRVVVFPDHHPYVAADVEGLLARHAGAAFLTTEKDAVKCDPAWFGGRPVGVLVRRLTPREPEILRQLVTDAIGWEG